MASKEERENEYCYLNSDPAQRLSEFERLTLLGGAGLERAISRMARGFSQFTFNPAHLSSCLLPSASHNSGSVDFCQSPSGEPRDLRITPVHSLPTGEVSDLQFSSEFVTNHKDRYSANEFDANRTAWVRLWERRDGGTCTIIALHAFTMGEQRLNSLAFLPGLFMQLGCNVALIELPFHGRRKAASEVSKSLDSPPDMDPVRTELAMGEIISDLRQLTSVLRERGHNRLGCMGMSLGGYAGGLWTALDKLDFSVLMVPLVSIGDLAWEIMSKDHQKDERRAYRGRHSDFKKLFASHCMLNYPCATDQKDILLLAGRGDKLIPRRQLDSLRRHWPEADFQWLHGGHAAGMHGGRALTIISEWMKARGLINPEAAVIE